MKNIHLPGDSKGRGLAAPARALLFLLLALALALPQGALASSTLPPPKVGASVDGNTLSVIVAPPVGADPSLKYNFSITVFMSGSYSYEEIGSAGTYIFPNLAPGEGSLHVYCQADGSSRLSETYQSTFIIKQDNTIILSGYPAVAYAGLTATVTVGSTYPVTNPQTFLSSSEPSVVSVAPGGSPNTYKLTFLKEGSFILDAILSGDNFYNSVMYSQNETVGPAFDINPPANFSAALNQDTGAVSLSWDPPTGNAANYLIGYDYIRRSGGTTYLPSSLTGEARGASYSTVLPEDGPVAFSARAIYKLPSQTAYSYSAYSVEVTVLRKADSYITALGLPAGASQPMGISLPVLVSHTGGDLQVANNAPLVCSITQSPMMGNAVQIIVTPKAPGTVSLTFSLPETETTRGYSLTYTHPVIAVPGPVLNGKVNGQGGTLSVSFDPPAPAAGFTLAGYTLRVEATSEEVVFEQAGTASPLSVSGLKPGETYNIFLNANFTEYGYQTTASLGAYSYQIKPDTTDKPERTPHPAVAFMGDREPDLFFLLTDGQPNASLPYRLAGIISLKQGNALRLSLLPYAFSGLGETIELRLPTSIITGLTRRGMAYLDTAFMGLRLHLGLDDLNALVKEGREGSLVVSLQEADPDTLGEDARAALADSGPVAFALQAAFTWQNADGTREALPAAALPHCGFEVMSGLPLLHCLPLEGEALTKQPLILGLGDGLYAVKGE